jgi:thiosulfate sulfurtransferase
MSSFKQIDVLGAKALMDTEQAVLVDIRDPGSFALSHPQGASHLNNDSLVTFMQEVGFEQPVLVICYHGISSQGAAQYLVNQGFEQVYSVVGGFDEWKRADLPVVVE